MALLTEAQSHGLGQHIWSLPKGQTKQALKYILIQEGPACLTSTFGRVSFALFLLVLLGRTARPKRAVLWCIVAVQVTINLIVVVQIYAQCGTQVSALWDPEVAAIARCQNVSVETNLGFVQSGENLKHSRYCQVANGRQP